MRLVALESIILLASQVCYLNMTSPTVRNLNTRTIHFTSLYSNRDVSKTQGRAQGQTLEHGFVLIILFILPASFAHT